MASLPPATQTCANGAAAHSWTMLVSAVSPLPHHAVAKSRAIEAHRLEVLEQQGLPALLRVMQLHPSHVGVQAQACLAIAHLALDGAIARRHTAHDPDQYPLRSDGVSAAANELGLTATVADVLSTHAPSNVDLASAALWAVSSLAKQGWEAVCEGRMASKY